MSTSPLSLLKPLAQTSLAHSARSTTARRTYYAVSAASSSANGHGPRCTVSAKVAATAGLAGIAASYQAVRAFATTPVRAEGASPAKATTYTLPDLPYAYDALEPAIPEEIMKLHHQKHHQTYVTGLNAAEEAFGKALAAGDVKKQIELQPALKFNGGGHLNHSLFWLNLAPTGSDATQLKSGSALEKAIQSEFGSVDAFKTKFNAKAAAIQGSGWCWLGKDKESGRLIIETTKDQDPLTGSIPVLGVDMWEHAFYLKYKNVKPDYLKAIWSVVNWETADARFSQA